MEYNRYLIKYYYIGSSKYHGSQRQNDYETVENILLNSLIKKKYISELRNSGFESASRTDKFVSARGAVFSFCSIKKPILMEINSDLPKNIGVWSYANVPKDFLSRFNATLRHYKYIYPITCNYNTNLMRKACKELEGKHDFINFSKIRKEENLETVRDMELVNLSIMNDYLIFDFKSKGFLRQQVRRMVKKLIELGEGTIDLSDFLEILDPSKRQSFQPAPPLGLILWDIHYEKSIEFSDDPKSIERREHFFSLKKKEYGIKHQLFTILQQNNLGK